MSESAIFSQSGIEKSPRAPLSPVLNCDSFVRVCPLSLTGIWDIGFAVGCAKSVSGVREQLGELLLKLNPEGGRRMGTQSQEKTGGA